MTRVLVLGGAGESADMARDLAQAGFDTTVYWSRKPLGTDLAATQDLRGSLAAAQAIVDVTHSFDTEIRALAHALRPDLPMMRLARAPWQPEPSDRWTCVPDLPRAIAALPAGARVFAATGRTSTSLFAHHDGPVFLRQRQAHTRKAPDNCTFVFGDGPFDAVAEAHLFADLRIDVLMARNVGGQASFPKVAAARGLDLPVVLIDPPPVPFAQAHHTPDALINALRARIPPCA